MTEKENLRRKFNARIYTFVLRLVKFLAALPNTPVIREVISQLMRSGTSIGANYFEARAASSKKDFQNFFTHSLKSSNETVFWFLVLRDSGLVPKQLIDECDWLISEAKELARIFASSILTMKGRR